MMRTATNDTGQLLVTVVVAREEGLLDKKIYDGEQDRMIPDAA
jgi:Na+/H+-dicarboxylate symporter